MQYATVDAPQKANLRQTTKVQSRFFYVHNPDAWEVRNGKVIPALSKDVIDVGLHNIKGVYAKNGDFVTYNVSNYLAEKSQKGWTVVPHNVDAPEHPSYMLEASPKCFVDRFTKVEPGGQGHIFDDEAYADWALSLVERGVLPKPTAFALTKNVRAASRRLEAFERQKGSLPSSESGRYDARLAELRRDLEALKAAMAETGDAGDMYLTPNVSVEIEAEQPVVKRNYGKSK